MSMFNEANIQGYDEMVAVTKETTGIEGAKSFRQSVVSAKVKRNDPCPCGSGKKFKKCCYLEEKV